MRGVASVKLILLDHDGEEVKGRSRRGDGSPFLCAQVVRAFQHGLEARAHFRRFVRDLGAAVHHLDVALQRLRRRTR